MKNSLYRFTCFLLIISLFSGIFIIPSGVLAKTDYGSYSNSKKSWYIMRQDNHKHSSGADSASNLRKYNAYYYDSKAKKNIIYFTFDCGYENGYTARILDTLKKHKVKAAFFVTEAFVNSSPKLCKRMKKEGHIVGNHTLNHPSLPSKSLQDIKKEVKGLEKLFKKKTGYTLDKYIRPPKGEFSTRVLKILKDMNYKTIFWSIAYYDYDPANQPGKQYVVDHFKKYHHKGAITLTHNISKSNTEALGEVISYLKSKKYKFGTLNNLK